MYNSWAEWLVKIKIYSTSLLMVGINCGSKPQALHYWQHYNNIIFCDIGKRNCGYALLMKLNAVPFFSSPFVA